MAIGTVKGAMDALNHGLIRAINRYLLVKTPIRPAKLCFVFGTRRGVEAFACRISGLWRAGYFEHAIISGGVTLGRKEAEAVVLRRRLIELGVPDSVILVETLATNTGENVALSLPILDREIGLHRIESLIAVGKFCASRRYLMTLQRHWPDVVKMLLPIHYHTGDRSRWMEDDELRCRILKEWSKIELYRQKGYLAELQSETCCLL